MQIVDNLKNISNKLPLTNDSSIYNTVYYITEAYNIITQFLNLTSSMDIPKLQYVFIAYNNYKRVCQS